MRCDSDDNGPQGGNLADVKQLNMVIAGTDVIAVDAFGATSSASNGQYGLYSSRHQRGWAV